MEIIAVPDAQLPALDLAVLRQAFVLQDPQNFLVATGALPVLIGEVGR